MAAYDHLEMAALADPYTPLAEMRATCPVQHSDAHDGFWSLFRYDDVVDAAKRHSTFSSKHVTIPKQDLPALPPPIRVDPPLHGEFRTPLLHLFSPGAVGKLEGKIRDRITRLIDGFIEQGKADLVPELTIPFPAEAALILLGLPMEHADQFTSWAQRIFLNQDDPSIALEVAGYFGELYEKTEPGDEHDLLSVARGLQINGEEINIIDFAMLMLTFVAAGLDTTTNGTALMLLLLAERPELRQQLIDDPDLLDTGIEEMLRFVTPLPALARVCTEATELGGTSLQEGDMVLLHWIAANHDPDEFENPDEVILNRTPNRHVAFGTGIHRCMGRHLARLELKIVLQEILRRLPDYEVDHDNVQRVGGVTRMIMSLPVTFTPGVRVGPATP